MIYTSHFGNIDAIDRMQPGMAYISIAPPSAGRPAGFKIVEFPSLAPAYNLYERWHDEYLGDSWYKAIYAKTVLEKLHPVKTAAEIKKAADGRDACLLDADRPGVFSHRHMVGEWLRKAGVPCVEWKPGAEAAVWSRDSFDLAACREFIKKVADGEYMPVPVDDDDYVRRAVRMADAMQSLRDEAWRVYAGTVH